jgi:hypothetical protein
VHAAVECAEAKVASFGHRYTKNISRAYDRACGRDSQTDGSLGLFNGITDRAAPQLGERTIAPLK